MEARLSRYRSTIDGLLREHEHAVRSVSENRKLVRRAKRKAKAAGQAHDILEQLSREVQQRVHLKIASVVTKCLKIFDDPYQFQIDFERKRNQTEARLTLVKGDLEVDPLSGAGGGVLDVASFALRIACLVLSRPARRRIMVLDEPFRFVSRGYLPALRELIESLSQDLDIQFILITHIPELEMGKVIEVDNG